MPYDKKVSVLIPCRNEVGTIDACLSNVFEFDPPEGGFEVIVIDGMSDDGTRDRLAQIKQRYRELVVIDNPAQIVPYAMNLGIGRARGEYIVRVDARCVHPRNYLVELLALSAETKADNVGGVLQPIGTTYTQGAIACAYRSRIAVGGALRDRGEYVGENDTVYGGCFRKDRLIEVGLYDEAMVRNQDDELSFRIRKSGGRIFQSGRIRVGYYPRKRFRQLFKQFLQYGFWKTVVIRKHPRQASPRHYIPSVFVAGLALLSAGTLVEPLIFLPFVFFAGFYLLAVSVAAFSACWPTDWRFCPGAGLAIVLMHVGYGAGFLVGLASNTFNLECAWFTTLSR